MEITIHDPREKGKRRPRTDKASADGIANEIDKLADRGFGLFLRSSSVEHEHRRKLVRNLLCAFPYPLLCFSVKYQNDVLNDMVINQLAKNFKVICSPQDNEVISIICEHSNENVDILFELYDRDPAWYLWTFSVAFESSYPELLMLAQSTGILNLWGRVEEVDDGMRELMPYYIICDEDWNTIQVRCMDNELYDPFVEYAEGLISR